MSDARRRELERQALAGGPHEEDALNRANCRAGKHTFDREIPFVVVERGGPFSVCVHCLEDKPYVGAIPIRNPIEAACKLNANIHFVASGWVCFATPDAIEVVKLSKDTS